MLTSVLIVTANASAGLQMLSTDMEPRQLAEDVTGYLFNGREIEKAAINEALPPFIEGIGQRQALKQAGSLYSFLQNRTNLFYTEKAVEVFHRAYQGEAPLFRDFFEATNFTEGNRADDQAFDYWTRTPVQREFYTEFAEFKRTTVDIFGNGSFITRLPFKDENTARILRETEAGLEPTETITIAEEYFWIGASVAGVSLVNRRQSPELFFSVRFGNPATEYNENAGRENTQLYPPNASESDIAIAELVETLQALELKEEKGRPGVFYSLKRLKYEKKIAAEEGREENPDFWTLEAIEICVDL